MYPRWFKLVFLGNASNQNVGKKDHPTGSMDSSGIVGLLCLLVNYPSFDLETSIKQLCCACSLKGIADKNKLRKA